MPSYTTFVAGFQGRCQSATNYVATESLTKLCDGAGCGITPGSSVAKALQAEQKIYKQKNTYNKSEKHNRANAEKDTTRVFHKVTGSQSI